MGRADPAPAASWRDTIMDLNAKPLPTIAAAPRAGSTPGDELSLDDLEFVVGGLSRPLSVEGNDVSIDFVSGLGLPGKAAAQ
jgi:hypothetical protein